MLRMRRPKSDTKRRAIFGELSKNFATASAFADCALTRSAIVSSPFKITQALNGESAGPVLRKNG